MPSPRRESFAAQMQPPFSFYLPVHNLISVHQTYLFLNQVILTPEIKCIFVTMDLVISQLQTKSMISSKWNSCQS